MSDPRIVGPLSLVGVTLGDAQQQFAASTPFQKGVGLACFGAVTLGFCGFFAEPVFAGSSPTARIVFGGIVAVALLLGHRHADGARPTRSRHGADIDRDAGRSRRCAVAVGRPGDFS